MFKNFSRLIDLQNFNRSEKGSILIGISDQLKLIGSISINRFDLELSDPSHIIDSILSKIFGRKFGKILGNF